MSLRIFCLLSFIIAAMVSCKKEPGDGGLATLEGSLYYNTYSPSGDFIEKIPAAGENVYLTYGDNDPYDDRNDTYIDGTYQFKNLQKGSYTISAFSDCICPSGNEAVELSVEITNKKGSTQVSDIVVTKTLDYNDGTATISGVIVQDEYNKDVPPTVDTSYVKPNENVFIVYGNDSAYFDKVKTNGLGFFQFTGLLKGSYRVYAFSDCSINMNCPDGIEEEDASVIISINGESINIGTITIDKR